MLGNMAHDNRGPRNKRFLVRNYSDTEIPPEKRYSACNKYHKSATHLPKIFIWQWKINAEMGIRGSINLPPQSRSRGRGDMITGHWSHHVSNNPARLGKNTLIPYVFLFSY